MSKFMSRLLKVVQNSILGFKSVEQTSKDDKGMTNSNPHEPLTTSSDRWLETAKIAWIPMKLKNRMKGYHFKLPGSLAQMSSLIREKTKRTRTSTRNRYLPPCDDTDSDLCNDIGKIIKRKRADKKKKKVIPLKKSSIPPIVVNGKTTKQNILIHENFVFILKHMKCFTPT